MQDEIRLDRLWSRLIWPILWPVLLAQIALVVLCLVVGVTLWSLVPSHASWSTTFWLLLALLLGSSLNVAVFLTLLRQRLSGIQRDVNDALVGIETWLAHHHRPQPGDELPLPQRLEALSAACEALVEGWQREFEKSRAAERDLASDLQASRGQLERLEAGRVRAREESSLKSDYLSHLQQSLGPLMSSLSEVLESDALRQCGGERDHAAALALRERLADAVVLLENLGESAGTSVTSPRPVPSVKGRVLIVDDGPVNLTLARQVLERQGLDVETATSGEEALSQLESAPFDLVLMDIFMPGMDGVETSRHWRDRESDKATHQRSILVALTANAGDEDRRRFHGAGMDDYLAKPYRPQELVDLVRRWLPLVLQERDSSRD
ncbi:response regulator [Halomonas daqiaonensis]|uniref:Response regulator receiver domain-containing protein n=1 Tax=Halomonas daqiaonensis TaxID=650850 RepID=A0A1H7MD51_9GAMM|nr:response regulator [Halomonas daqiaonensis]SEL08537.1 Response regulator receiver domain-containing protein [Halomonas daqiaonensis]